MKMNLSRQFKVNQILLGVAIVFTLLLARDVKAGDENEHDHLVTDWSHRHLVFSEPKSLMKRFQLSTDTRYLQQVKRKNAERRGIGRDEWRWYHAPQDPHSLKGDWSMNMGAGATAGAGNYPAKYTFNATTANCATDFVVYNTSLAGSGSQATIAAFNNLYTGTCSGTTPLTYWAYNTGTAGAVTTSPILSFDGTQVAFVQNAGTSVNLVVLRWKASNGTLAAPVVPPTGPCTALTAPCMQIIPFSTVNGDAAVADNTSSPYYDYAQDTIYVGDSSGFLHKFTQVFLGTPTEVVSAAPSAVAVWPVNLTTGFGLLNSPVFVGPPYNEVLVTDNGGLVYAVDSTKGGVDNTTFNNLDPKLADPGFEDAPLVDVTTGKMYLFARASSEFITPADPPFYGTPGVPSVFEVVIPTTPGALHLPGGSTTGTYNGYIQSIISDSTTAPIAIPNAMYVGTFDDVYYSGGTNSGFMYACGTHTAAGVTVNALWVIAVDSGVMDPTTLGLGPSLTTAMAVCSPITEFNNTSGTNVDRIFLSVSGSPVTAAPISCTAGTGCIMSFDVDSPLLSTSPTLARAPQAGGTSGIVVDNTAATGGTSQVYFTPLSDQTCAGAGGVGTGSGGCAIQASQSGLN